MSQSTLAINKSGRMFWQDGQLIYNGKYKIEKYLGGGGFAVTYQAMHTKLNRRVVIKTPNIGIQRDPDYPKYVERFKKEAQMLAMCCTDLRTIDQLWVKYSKGHFGFSVQKRIWLKCGGNILKYDYKTECLLGDRLGWRKNGMWLEERDRGLKEYFSFQDYPEGHLPTRKRTFHPHDSEFHDYGIYDRRNYQLFFSRVQTCKL